jgi:hypothetical protein
MCRPFGAVNDRAACPTVSTVGYVVTSLRDFEQHDRRTSDINIDRKFLRGRLLVPRHLLLSRVHGLVDLIKALNRKQSLVN